MSPLLLVLVTAPLTAQELAPRAYWPAPRGTTLVSLGYSYSTGDVLVDPSLPVEDVDTQTHGLSFSYLRFFSLDGRTASWNVEIPTARSSFDALLNGMSASRRVTGFADMRIRLAVNLLGAPSMTPAEFRAFRKDPRGAFGASLRIQAPTGKYNPDRAANIGTNRWAFKPELGYLHPFGDRWVAEVDLGVWIYGDNSDFLGQRLEQDPLASAELHLVRRQRAGFWTSLDLNFFYGGRTTVDSVRKDTLQKNSRFGVTFAYPFSRHHAVKLAFSTNLTTESGGDYDSAILAYTFVWI